jgi:hypothetical protein
VVSTVIWALQGWVVLNEKSILRSTHDVCFQLQDLFGLYAYSTVNSYHLSFSKIIPFLSQNMVNITCPEDDVAVNFLYF